MPDYRYVAIDPQGRERGIPARPLPETFDEAGPTGKNRLEIQDALQIICHCARRLVAVAGLTRHRLQ